ncbi:MAG TPA: hypothetical protein VGO26_05940 [Amnibacterium sp.]|nr:hypothetical protein [Amnibacterium sp.]
MTTPASPSATESHPSDPADEEISASAPGEGTHRDDVTDNLPLPNDPLDATGLLSAGDLNGEAPD